MPRLKRFAWDTFYQLRARERKVEMNACVILHHVFEAHKGNLGIRFRCFLRDIFNPLSLL